MSKKTPLRYPDNHFDISYSNRILCHVTGWDFLLEEMIRVTKPGGKVITTCPDWSSLTSTVVDTWLEGLIKIFLEQMIGKDAYNYTK